MRRVTRAIAAALLLATPAALGATSAGAATPGGLTLQSTARLSPRLTQLTPFSPALGRSTLVRVLTPTGFDPARDHLPVLWLLHGGFGSASDWTAAGQAEPLTAGLPLIVVMPDAGIGGWYSDWKRPSTRQGMQFWETYHVRELMPFIKAHYQTRTDRSGQAIAGLSMGGFGAMHDAVRHPDLYGFAASFSGAVDILHPGVTAVADISPLAHGGVPDQIWGNRVVDEPTWRANNPVDLAANLRTVETQLRTGNGMPGGAHGDGAAPDIQEIGVSQATATLHERLNALGIPHLYDDYGPGQHNYAYWIDDLRATLPRIVAATATPRPDPTTVDHVAFEPSFSVWGFDVALDRTALEPTVLSIRPDAFALRGAGSGTVTTPARYAPGQHVLAGSRDLVANAAGRVIVPVDLGVARFVDVTLRAVPLARVEAVHAVGPTLPETGRATSVRLLLVLGALGLVTRRCARVARAGRALARPTS